MHRNLTDLIAHISGNRENRTRTSNNSTWNMRHCIHSACDRDLESNMLKLKDVDCLIINYMEGNLNGCAKFLYHGQSFFRSLLSLLDQYNNAASMSRILNDALRLGNSKISLVSVLVVFSTAAFDGLHCFAWNSDSLSILEKNIWKLEWLVSATIPLFALLVSSFVVHAL
jgi:hypothetical protein